MRQAVKITEIMKKQVVLKIYGRVQGVLFRYSSQKKAKDLNLSGWARNETDGTVQIVAEGEEKDLNEFINWCRSGEVGPAKVDKVDIEWQEPTGEFNDFSVK